MRTATTTPLPANRGSSPRTGAQHFGRWVRAKLEPSHGHPKNLTMEGLRGTAILLVFAVHYAEFSAGLVPIGSLAEHTRLFLLQAGQCGVDLFFVLSGYLIYGSLIKRDEALATYASKRIKRIYPTFLAALFLYITLFILLPERSKLPAGAWQIIEYIILNILLLPILPFFSGVRPIMNATWSLAYEILFYILAPILIRFFRIRERSSPTRLKLCIFATISTYIALVVFDQNTRPTMFLAGATLFEIGKVGWRAPPSSYALLALTAAIAWTGFSKLEERFPTPELATLFVVVCWSAFHVEGILADLLRWTPLRWLGNISYSFYLIHGIVVQTVILGAKRAGIPMQFAMLWPVAFGLAVVASLALYLSVEWPMSLASRKRARNT